MNRFDRWLARRTLGCAVGLLIWATIGGGTQVELVVGFLPISLAAARFLFGTRGPDI